MGSRSLAAVVVIKEAAKRDIDRAGDALVELSHTIHGHPETRFEEHQASALVADMLADSGFTVDSGVCGMDTAFVATAGHGALTLAICAEYDALPGIGHACGHNVIAAAAVGAGLALARVAEFLDITVKVMGTPAEEGGGGKILMLEGGAFAGVHASMMVHPMPMDVDAVEAVTLAVSHLDVRFHGKSAHASAYPYKGVNASDAMTISQVAIGLLRQQLRPSERVHGIVTKGGDAPNIIPEDVRGEWYVRADTLEHLARLEPRVRACFEAGALAAGATLDVGQMSPPYSEFRHDEVLGRYYAANAESLGRRCPDVPRSMLERFAGSTDMANVSLVIPSIHPSLGLDCLPASNHQPEFTAAAASGTADKAILDGATAMAWTCIDIAQDDAERARLTV
jgi:amidohydrolase